MADTDNLQRLASLLGDVDNAQRVKLPFGLDAHRLDGQFIITGQDLLPRDLRPSPEQFSEVGFLMGRIRDGMFLEAKLPHGWSKRASSDACHTDILDDRMRVRGSIYFNAAFYERAATAALFCRYRVRTWSDEIDLESCRVGIWDQETEAFLEDFGTARTDDGGKHKVLVLMAEAWLDKRHPDHRNTSAYW